ncbi:MAG: chromosome segregation protein SMC [Clostridiales bacterium]|nr:chromosome segregation protein SMC [Clostridiales bacterium]
MVLKALEIHGFKSFPDKTVLSFDRGMTAVVGPNGSGKSNISDAIRWVLGEQSTKSLRGSKMEDVIFNGTSRRKAVGFAEVSLIIENKDRNLDFDADDVKITRRYYRSGDSEYLLNNASVRLRDVQMLFMDTGLGRDGYSIIGQGRIGDMVSYKSEERREIFEEAAGIAKYRYRKNEAERRLKGAEENLLRLRDIVQELEERVGPLKAQAEKAKLFLTYAEEKRGLEIGLWLHTLEQSTVSLRELDGRLELARTQYDAAGADMDGVEARIEEVNEEARRLEAEMDQVRRRAQSLEEEAARCEGEVAVLRNDIFHNNEHIVRVEEDIARSHEGGQSLETEMEQRREEIRRKQEEICAGEAEQSALSEELEQLSRSSEEMSGRIEALSKEASALALQLSDIRVKTVTSDSSLSEITLRLSQLTAGIALRHQQGETARRALSECEENTRLCVERTEELQNAVRGYELRLQSRRSRREAAQQEADRLRLDAEEKRRRVRLLEDLEKNMEGFAHSVRAVMKQAERGALRGILGPVSRLIETRPETALAVETALGAAAQNLVCEREEDAKRGIAFLKESRGGRATFLPLSAVRGSLLNERGLAEEPGFVGLGSELVDCEPRYEAVVCSLLGRTAVAEDLDYAVSIARKYGYRFRVVTLDGQVVNAGGSLTGGSHVKNAGLLSRRAEIERLRGEAAALAAEAEAASEKLRQAAQECAASEAELTGTKGDLANAQEDRIRFEAELRRLREQEEANERAVNEFAAEIETLNHRAEECRLAAAAAAIEAAQVRQQQAGTEEELNRLTGGRQELSDRREELSARLAEHKLSVVSCHKEIEANEAAIEELRARHAAAAGRAEELKGQIDALHQANEEIEARIQAALTRAGELREQAAGSGHAIEELQARRVAGEQQQTELRRLSRDKAEEREKLSREIARLEEKCAAVRRESDDLVRRLLEEYELTRSEAEAVARPVEDAPAAGRRLGELKGKIRALGSVNVEAIEEYQEVSERYEFLSAQVADVETSRAELLKLIGDLTVQMREIFLERFKQINYHFGTVFQELFGGGRAELKLTAPDDILNSGIEMYVQPPGKVILNMDALSGGEKALVAIALLFAILKVSPSPFCVLDEIEAALDDVNVDRYAAYLKRMTDHIQFIAITHRRGTMEEADVLYGVTMQEQGVSKLLELRASEVEQKLGLKLETQNQ